MEVVAGRYRPLAEVGRGGMGVVHLARDEHTGATVALKRLGAGAGVDATFRARFAREADALARVRHPNVVAIRDRGEDEHGPWLAMDHCAGGTLADRLRDGVLGAGAARDLAGDVLDALAAVHAAGLVHRDVKPANILGHQGHWLLSDFGIARDAEGGTTALTATGLLIGTPEYMAPEHMEEAVPGAPADLYALGCVLHEALTGRPPFAASNPLRAAMLHISEPPPALPETVRTDDPALAGLVADLMAKDPAARPTAVEGAARLGRTVHAPTMVMPVPGPVPAPLPTLVMTRPPRERHRGRRAAIIAAGILALAGGGGAAWYATSGGDAGDGADPGAATVVVTTTVPAQAEPPATTTTPAPEPEPQPEPTPEGPQTSAGVVAAGEVAPNGLEPATAGMSTDEVWDLWGEPGQYEPEFNASIWDDLGVIAYGDPVLYLHASGRDWVTPSGATIGMPEQALSALYGQRLVRVDADDEGTPSEWDSEHHYYVVDGDVAVGFAIDGGRIVELIATDADLIEDAMAYAGVPF
ncbi:MAG: serine/threonine-protein kinase [Miltoncostaeaceae bacterium]